jgi:hypothetical protein
MQIAGRNLLLRTSSCETRLPCVILATCILAAKTTLLETKASPTGYCPGLLCHELQAAILWLILAMVLSCDPLALMPTVAASRSRKAWL